MQMQPPELVRVLLLSCRVGPTLCRVGSNSGELDDTNVRSILDIVTQTERPARHVISYVPDSAFPRATRVASL